MFRILLPFGVLLLSTTMAFPTTWHIEPDGSGDAPTIQAGIDSAAAGDTVELADGVYLGDGNRDVDFLGKAIVVTAADYGPPEKAGGSCVVDCEGSTAAPHRGFLFVRGEGPAALLRGITITGGVVNDSGAGVLCMDGSSPTLEGVRFVDNSAVGRGGGLFTFGGAPELIDCFFSGNFARAGGGMSARHSSPVLRNVRFEENEASLASAGLDLMQSDGSLEECVFFRNRGGNAGAAMVNSASTTTFTDCSFIENEAYQYVGGVWVAGTAEPTFENCLFLDNFSVQIGGALTVDVAGGTFRECVFAGNSSRVGGGLLTGGGIRSYFYDCTFADNRADVEGSFFYGIDGVGPLFERTVVAFHGGGETVVCNAGAVPVFVCSDLYGNAGGDWTGCIADQLGVEDNFSADPLFCDRPANDFTLRSDSPCLPGNHPDGADCGTIGAFGEGCGGPTSVEYTSWGAVKSLFR